MESSTEKVEIVKNKEFNAKWLGIILLLSFGFLTTFIAGYGTRSLLISEQTPSPKPNISPKPSESSPPGIEQPTTKFLSGKHYFDDTVFIVSKEEPHYTLIATVARTELRSGYQQATRVSYFDGKNWDRKLSDHTYDSPTIRSSNIIKSWQTRVDESRVLKEQTTGTATFGSNDITFDTGPLFNEISMRSLPGYTKFMSRGEGKMTINGNSYNAYTLYSRIYSLNASDIQFYDTPLGVTTDWMAFWDESGNFYHLDSTEVERPTDIYRTHHIAIFEEPSSRQTKSFNLTTSRNSLTNPSQYNYKINDPINVELSLERINVNNKASTPTYVWQIGQVKGTVTKSDGSQLQGFGLVEYIHD